MRNSRLSRRGLLRGALAGGAALGLGVRPTWAADVTGKPPAGKIGDFKLSLAEWSFHNALFKNEMTHLDFPVLASETYGIKGIELINQFFKDKAHDEAYLKEFKQKADDHGVTCVLIMCDGEGDISSPEKAQRMQAAENHKKWVDAAVRLGCHSIRINTGEHYGPTETDNAAEACSALAEYGKQHKIHVICENHWGPSSNPDAMIALVKAVGSDYFGTLPDFGNFPKEVDRYDAIARMMPYATGVSAKSYDFDEKGDETTLDFARIMKIVTDSGYHGFVGIEYEGSRLSEPEGIKATKKLLERLRNSSYTPR